ncbi:NADH dehydrogenase [Anopheles sinensis]|uniref:NADH dehydrogenase n=1 Tax=Anopheles sinensis TaxID=74873 RepID=A0A084VR88_ANOSI|nr:NADH dehydrogenase [Anopheles sinensis]
MRGGSNSADLDRQQRRMQNVHRVRFVSRCSWGVCVGKNFMYSRARSTGVGPSCAQGARYVTLHIPLGDSGRDLVPEDFVAGGICSVRQLMQLKEQQQD